MGKPSNIKNYATFKEVRPDQDKDFTLNNVWFTRDKFAAAFIEKAFGVEIFTCYKRMTSATTVRLVTQNHMEVGCTDLIIFLKSGIILEIGADKWTSLEIIGD